MSEKILVQTTGPVAVIIINRPEVHNAMDRDTWQLLKKTLNDVDEDDSIRAVIITGAGEKAFAAGADLNSLRERSVLETVKAENSKAAMTLEMLSKPTIAAINGYCFGGGLEIALACDIRIASEKARLGQTEINVGIIPGAGGTQRLRNLVGLGKAMEMILTGETVTAEEAYRIGLVNKVAPADQLLKEARKIAVTIAAKSPIAVQLARKSIRNGQDMTMEKGLLLESLYQAVCFSTEDHLEGIDAFLEKRAPKYKGR